MIVVTGGAGFIGSNLIRALNDRGRDDILVVDNLRESDKWIHLTGCRIADYMHRDAFPEWLKRCGDRVEVIFHMGACSATTERDVDFLMRVNYAYTQALWKWGCRHAGRLIYASSAATYGDGTAGYDDVPEAIDRLRPLNAYGFSKHLFDQWALARVARGKAPAQWVGLKFFNVYGPREDHKGRMASVVLHAFHQARKEGVVRLFKSYKDGIDDGGQMRDFVYVKDCAAVMTWLLDHPEVSGIYNLGTGTARTFRDLATSTLQAMNLPVRIQYIDMPEDLKGRYQYFTQANMARLRGAGYSAPFTPLEDGVGDYVKGFLNDAG